MQELNKTKLLQGMPAYKMAEQVRKDRKSIELVRKKHEWIYDTGRKYYHDIRK